MMDYVLDYMAEKGQYADTREEQERMEQGILLYLAECGISDSVVSEYRKKYVKAHLEIIDRKDLKQYFLCYPLISEVVQIAIEQKTDGEISEERRGKLYQLMEQLYENGLGETYIPYCR